MTVPVSYLSAESLKINLFNLDHVIVNNGFFLELEGGGHFPGRFTELAIDDGMFFDSFVLLKLLVGFLNLLVYQILQWGRSMKSWPTLTQTRSAPSPIYSTADSSNHNRLAFLNAGVFVRAPKFYKTFATGRECMLNFDLNALVLLCLLVMNVLTLCLFGGDKWLARHHKRRIRERDLLLGALLGGSIGGLIGMHVFHHKTRHIKFKWGLPLIMLLQGSLLLYMLY